jgi:hypothetical protein
MLLGLLLSGGIAAGLIVGTSGAGAARSRSEAAAGKPMTVHAKVPLPPMNVARISLITLRVKAPKGTKPPSISVQSASSTQPRPMVVVTEAPGRPTRNPAFKVFVGINRSGSAPSHAIAAQGSTLDLVIQIGHVFGPVTVKQLSDYGDCDGLKTLEGLFEDGNSVIHDRGKPSVTFYRLKSLGVSGAAPTSAEGDLDEVVADAWGASGCPGQPEAFDDGLDPIHAVFTPEPPGQSCRPPYCTTVYTEPTTAEGLKYEWTVAIPTDPECAKGFQPKMPMPNQATWYHADTNAGGYCNHSGADYNARGSGHPGTVTVTATTAHWSCTATFQGTQGPQAQATWDGPVPGPCQGQR